MPCSATSSGPCNTPAPPAEWATLKDELANDTSDQAAVDAATSRVDAALSRVRGVDLVPDQPEPTNPADNPNEPDQP